MLLPELGPVPLLAEYNELPDVTAPVRRTTEDRLSENGEFLPNFLSAENALVAELPLAAVSAMLAGGLDGAL